MKSFRSFIIKEYENGTYEDSPEGDFIQDSIDIIESYKSHKNLPDIFPDFPKSNKFDVIYDFIHLKRQSLDDSVISAFTRLWRDYLSTK